MNDLPQPLPKEDLRARFGPLIRYLGQRGFHSAECRPIRDFVLRIQAGIAERADEVGDALRQLRLVAVPSAVRAIGAPATMIIQEADCQLRIQPRIEADSVRLTLTLEDRDQQRLPFCLSVWDDEQIYVDDQAFTGEAQLPGVAPGSYSFLAAHDDGRCCEATLEIAP